MVNKKKTKKVKTTKNVSSKGELRDFNFLNPKNKTQLVFKNLLVFVGLFVFSIIGGNLVSNDIFTNLFIILTIISMGFILGLFITLMVLILLKRKVK